VWAFAPVQDRRAAPAISRALVDLAAIETVEVIVVARGGGSLADLFCFCDETLCRTVAMLRVPVIASVGHHTDRTLIDDVAAVCASTPTHAAEAAVPLHCAEARAALTGHGQRLAVHARRAVVTRARELVTLSRAPGRHVARERRALHQSLRELRASAARRVAEERAGASGQAEALDRRAGAAAGAGVASRRAALNAMAAALGAHDPGRVLARGYAIAQDQAGELVTSAAAARKARSLRLRFADDHVDARIQE